MQERNNNGHVKAARTFVFALTAVVLFAVGLMAQEASPREAAVTLGWAVAVFPSGAEYSLEIARTDDERALGYMFRHEVGEHDGMLFFFDEDGPHSFWMKNCMVSLDIIWLDQGLRVVHIAADTPPCPAEGACPSVVPAAAGRYVLEVAAGQAAKHGLGVGDQLVVLSEPSLF